MKALSRALTACMVMLTLVVNAQPKSAPSWSAKFKTPITWQRVHSLGYLIVNTNDGLYGVNPDDGKILWHNKNFAAINPDFYQEVEGTEFLTIAYQTDKTSTIPMQAIIRIDEVEKEGSGKVTEIRPGDKVARFPFAAGTPAPTDN